MTSVDLVALVLEKALDQAEHDERPCVADVDAAVHGRPARIDAHLAGVARLQGLAAPRVRVSCRRISRIAVASALLARLAIASAATPSPRPTNPIPSPVVAFTFTRSSANRAPAPAARGSPAVGAELRALHHDGAVDVHDFSPRRSTVATTSRAAPASRRRASARRCRGSARRYRPSRRAEQRVDHRVGQHIGVGVPLQAELAGDLHPAEDQPAALARRCES